MIAIVFINALLLVRTKNFDPLQGHTYLLGYVISET